MSGEPRIEPGPIRGALSRGGVIDITTFGRTSGKDRRISGTPLDSKRTWLANLESNPQPSTSRAPSAPTLAAQARIIIDDAERRAILAPIAASWSREDPATMVAQSPLIEFDLAGLAPR